MASCSWPPRACRYLNINTKCLTVARSPVLCWGVSFTDAFQKEQHETWITANISGCPVSRPPCGFSCRRSFSPLCEAAHHNRSPSNICPKPRTRLRVLQIVLFWALYLLPFLLKNQYDTCKAALFPTPLPPASSEELKIKHKVISYFKPKLERVLIQWDKLQLRNFYQASRVRWLKERKKKPKKHTVGSSLCVKKTEKFWHSDV